MSYYKQIVQLMNDEEKKEMFNELQSQMKKEGAGNVDPDIVAFAKKQNDKIKTEIKLHAENMRSQRA